MNQNEKIEAYMEMQKIVGCTLEHPTVFAGIVRVGRMTGRHCPECVEIWNGQREDYGLHSDLD